MKMALIPSVNLKIALPEDAEGSADNGVGYFLKQLPSEVSKTMPLFVLSKNAKSVRVPAAACPAHLCFGAAPVRAILPGVGRRVFPLCGSARPVHTARTLRLVGRPCWGG